MGRSENVAIFEDTMRRCETDAGLKEAVARSRERTVLVREGDALACRAGEKRREWIAIFALYFFSLLC